MSNPLMAHPQYKFEDVDSGFLQIGIGNVVFETYPLVARFGWRARDAGPGRQKIVAQGPTAYARRGNAERAMRKFIINLLETGK